MITSTSNARIKRLVNLKKKSLKEVLIVILLLSKKKPISFSLE